MRAMQAKQSEGFRLTTRFSGFSQRVFDRYFPFVYMLALLQGTKKVIWISTNPIILWATTLKSVSDNPFQPQVLRSQDWIWRLNWKQPSLGIFLSSIIFWYFIFVSTLIFIAYLNKETLEWVPFNTWECRRRRLVNQIHEKKVKKQVRHAREFWASWINLSRAEGAHCSIECD